MDKKKFYIGRHGKKAEDGKSLALDSVPTLYQLGSDNLGDFASELS